MITLHCISRASIHSTLCLPTYPSYPGMFHCIILRVLSYGCYCMQPLPLNNGYSSKMHVTTLHMYYVSTLSEYPTIPLSSQDMPQPSIHINMCPVKQELTYALYRIQVFKQAHMVLHWHSIPPNLAHTITDSWAWLGI